MVEPLSIKDLNCSTCDAQCEVMPKSKRKTCTNELSPRYRARRLAVEMKGCASHPLALQVLAQPIAEELEQLKSTTVPTKQVLTFDEAITLLRGDDKCQ
jgi:hypothetical protein